MQQFCRCSHGLSFFCSQSGLLGLCSGGTRFHHGLAGRFELTAGTNQCGVRVGTELCFQRTHTGNFICRLLCSLVGTYNELQTFRTGSFGVRAEGNRLQH